MDQALLNLSYTKVYAPANGIVGKRAVQLGSRIQPGQTLMFVTETDKVWVTANFKETQLARMHRGERVTIHVDTFGLDYRGYVSICLARAAIATVCCHRKMRPAIT